MDQRSLLRYWRASLADADRNEPDAALVRRSPRIRRSDIDAGKLPREAVDRIFSENKLGQQEKTARVLICPWRGAPEVKNGQTVMRDGNERADDIRPMWIPANLVRTTGELLLIDETPWFSRRYLEPQDIGGRPVVGTVEAVDHFLGLNDCPTGENVPWLEYWRYCANFFEYVTGENFDNYSLEGYVTDDSGYVLPYDSIRGASASLIRLYDDLLHDRRDLSRMGLLGRFISGIESEAAPISGADFSTASSSHLGQMDRRHHLSAQQRQTLYQQLQGENAVLAVNGPPGTGKTSFLKSVVASHYVEAALNETQPPLIVASSANNQAITNIIDSFGDNADSLRWLPDIPSFGLLMPSQSAIDNKDSICNYLYTTTDGEGFTARVESSAFLAKAETYFMEKAVARYPGIASLKDAQQRLHADLSNTVSAIRTAVTLFMQSQRLAKQALDEGGEEAVAKREKEIQEHIQAREEAIFRVGKAIRESRNQVRRMENLRKRFEEYTTQAPAWMDALEFLPFVKTLHGKRNKTFLAVNAVNVNQPIDWSDTAAVGQYLQRLILAKETDADTHDQRLAELERSLEYEHQRLDAAKATLENARQLIRQYVEFARSNQLLDIPAQMTETLEGWVAHGDEIMGRVNAALDTRHRFEAFSLAVKYWEACWIQETKRNVERPISDLKKDAEQRLRRQAMLLPCFVATLYSLPNFFRYYGNGLPPPYYMYGAIDLLILDEAGQIIPSAAVAPMALAKKALVVGDVLQLPPIYTLQKASDIGNLRNSGVLNKEDEAYGNKVVELTDKGLLASSGSAMRMAQRASDCRIPGLEYRGMLLTDHYRCVPEIIAYCNDLCYHDLLKPVRPSLTTSEAILPSMGYAHIRGETRKAKNGTGKVNRIEARAIIRWLAAKRDLIEQRYGPLESAVCLITPYKGQEDALRAEARASGMRVGGKNGMVIGTVHSLQGAERDIVIFSPASQLGESLKFVEAYMLNVVVSRAKNHFLTMGDMRNFYPSEGGRFGLLGRHLYQRPENEITDIPIEMPEAYRHRFANDETSLLQGREAHHTVFMQTLSDAKEAVTIVAPRLSINENTEKGKTALEAIRHATQRGVSITVITDSDLDKKGSRLSEQAALSREALEKVGASLDIRSNIFDKALLGEEVMVHGAYDWLCYDRTHSEPLSILYSGNAVSAAVRDFLQQQER